MTASANQSKIGGTPIDFTAMRESMIFGSPTVFMLCPLPREEVSRRLNDEIARNGMVSGRANEEYFVLRKRLPFLARNSFQVLLHCSLFDDENGTIVRCDFRVPLLSMAALGVWILVTIAASFAALSSAINARHYDPGQMLFASLFPLSGFALYAGCRLLSREEPGFLKEFVRRAIRATEY